MCSYHQMWPENVRGLFFLNLKLIRDGLTLHVSPLSDSHDISPPPRPLPENQSENPWQRELGSVRWWVVPRQERQICEISWPGWTEIQPTRIPLHINTFNSSPISATLNLFSASNEFRTWTHITLVRDIVPLRSIWDLIETEFTFVAHKNLLWENKFFFVKTRTMRLKTHLD